MKLLILVDNNNAIAKDGEQIMFVDDDLEMFKNYTTNNIIVMGRKTFDDIGRQLPNRISVVFTRSEKEDKEDLFYVDSEEKLDEIIKNIQTRKSLSLVGQKLSNSFGIGLTNLL